MMYYDINETYIDSHSLWGHHLSAHGYELQTMDETSFVRIEKHKEIVGSAFTWMSDPL